MCYYAGQCINYALIFMALNFSPPPGIPKADLLLLTMNHTPYPNIEMYTLHKCRLKETHLLKVIPNIYIDINRV